jgi:hypothetical protein
MQHIFFNDRVLAKKPDGFIAPLRGGRIRRGALKDTKEHMVECSLGLEFVVRVAAHDLSLDLPRAGHALN